MAYLVEEKSETYLSGLGSLTHKKEETCQSSQILSERISLRDHL